MLKLIGCRVLNKLKSYKEDKFGNISFIAAVATVPIMTAMNLVFEYQNFVNNYEHLQSLSDRAILAAISIDGATDEEREAAYINYIEEGINPAWKLVDVKSSAEFETGFAEITGVGHARGRIESNFLNLTNVGDMNIIAASKTALGIENLEVVLVLDISSSMSSGSRFVEAKAAAKNLIDEVLVNQKFGGDVSISIVPFGGAVRVPQSYSNMIRNQSTLTNPQLTKNWVGGQWNQCLKIEPYTSVADAVFLPTDEFTIMPDYYTWRSNNSWCPGAGNEFLPLTDDAGALKSKIDSLSLSDGTATHHGLAWAQANLSSSWRGVINNNPDLPSDNVQGVSKFVILMSDGGVSRFNNPTYADQINNNDGPLFKSTRQLYSTQQMEESYQYFCQALQEDNIQVYTVGFALRKQNHKDSLRNCATTDAHYYESDEGQLKGVFSEIVTKLAPIRITG